MSRFPSMPLFIDAYLADTTHFSAEEHGAYLLLLMAMWRRNGRVPNDNRDLARMCCVSVKRWPRIKARLMPLLIEQDGELSQKRLTTVWAELKNKLAPKGSSDRHTQMNGNNDLPSARARARLPEPERKNLFDVAPSFHARENGNGSAPASAGALGLEGRAPQPPIAKGRAPPPDKEWPPPSYLKERIYGKAAKPDPKPRNGTQPGRDRGRPRKTAAPKRTAEDKPGAQKGTEGKGQDPSRT
jgi:uncharacterized protein YdaU (DUF1376 family)